MGTSVKTRSSPKKKKKKKKIHIIRPRKVQFLVKCESIRLQDRLQNKSLVPNPLLGHPLIQLLLRTLSIPCNRPRFVACIWLGKWVRKQKYDVGSSWISSHTYFINTEAQNSSFSHSYAAPAAATTATATAFAALSPASTAALLVHHLSDKQQNWTLYSRIQKASNESDCIANAIAMIWCFKSQALEGAPASWAPLAVRERKPYFLFHWNPKRNATLKVLIRGWKSSSCMDLCPIYASIHVMRIRNRCGGIPNFY